MKKRKDILTEPKGLYEMKSEVIKGEIIFRKLEEFFPIEIDVFENFGFRFRL